MSRIERHIEATKHLPMKEFTFKSFTQEVKFQYRTWIECIHDKYVWSVANGFVCVDRKGVIIE